jgi:hypothetical protein
VAQDRLLQTLKIGARLDPDLLHEQPPRFVKRLKRLGLAPAAIQRKHPLGVQALSQRVLRQQRLHLTQRLLMAAGGQVGVDRQLGGRLA